MVESSSVAIEIVYVVSSVVTDSVETGDKTDSVVVGICDIVVGTKVSVWGFCVDKSNVPVDEVVFSSGDVSGVSVIGSVV